MHGVADDDAYSHWVGWSAMLHTPVYTTVMNKHIEVWNAGFFFFFLNMVVVSVVLFMVMVMLLLK